MIATYQIPVTSPSTAPAGLDYYPSADLNILRSIMFPPAPKEQEEPEATFTCTKCGATLPISKCRKGHKTGMCADCYKQYLRDWHAAHKIDEWMYRSDYAQTLNGMLRIKYCAARRRARKWGVQDTLTFPELLEIWGEEPVCHLCQCAYADTLDHIIPLSAGGPNNKYNIVPVCASCNNHKHKSEVSKWFKKILKHNNTTKVLQVITGSK